ncbi:MAG TPA: metallopeptidase family protein [Candidatus Methylomirabilis sp.]|nr:metallopeptidase family protein [Candidatus Methylomirabilis sp.]
MARLSRTDFEKLVARAMESLPPRFLAMLQNVEVVVQSRPTYDELEVAGIEPGGTLLGLYQGVPQTQRGTWYGSVLPDRIVIYQRPIEAIARTPREIRKQVRITLMHEIGHHFGLDEEAISEAGYE